MDTKRVATPDLTQLTEQLTTELADGHPADAVQAIDQLLQELYALRQQKVTEAVRRQKALLAELDEKYGPLR